MVLEAGPGLTPPRRQATALSSSASLVFFFKPALAPVLALVFLQEAIPVSMVVGVLFILAGSLVSLIPALSTIPAMALGKVWCWKQGRA